MIAVPLLLAPLVMAGASVLERRIGPAAAGWFAALPVAFTVAVLAVAAESGSATAQAMSLSAAAHVPAQLVFGLVCAHVLHRFGLWLGLVAGTAAYAVGSVALGLLPTWVCLVIALLLLLTTPRWMPTVAAAPPRPRPVWISALTCLAASLVVAAAVITTQLAGPVLAGTVAAFPTMCLALTIAVSLGGQRAAGVRALTGLVRSLPCYFTFCLVAALGLPTFGPVIAVIAVPAALLVAGVTWWLGSFGPRPGLAR